MGNAIEIKWEHLLTILYSFVKVLRFNEIKLEYNLC